MPRVYEQVCQNHAAQGSYVLALASKSLGRINSDAEISGMTREDCEKDLDLIGLLLFKNMLKPVCLYMPWGEVPLWVLLLARCQ